MSFYTSKKAVEFLSKRLKTELEAEALNRIIEDLNHVATSRINENVPFAKLFLHFYARNLLAYGSSKEAWKNIIEILKTPLENQYDEVFQAYCDVNILRVFEENLIPTEYTEIVEGEPLNKMHPKDIRRIKEYPIKLETLKTKLNEMITTTLNDNENDR